MSAASLEPEISAAFHMSACPERFPRPSVWAMITVVGVAVHLFGLAAGPPRVSDGRPAARAISARRGSVSADAAVLIRPPDVKHLRVVAVASHVGHDEAGVGVEELSERAFLT